MAKKEAQAEKNRNFFCKGLFIFCSKKYNRNQENKKRNRGSFMETANEKRQFETPEQMDAAAALFGDWPETILWSVLQGKMGCMYVDDPERPASAAAVLGDFVFLAGEPSADLIRFAAELGYPLDMCIYMPQNAAWEQEIETALACLGPEKLRKVTRYATHKSIADLQRPEVLERLQQMADAVPRHFQIREFDEEIFEIARGEYWSRSQAVQFRDYEEFREHGVGFAAFLGGIMAAGASTYSYYDGGIEVQIDTDTGFREMGLAQCCGARLILACLERGIYPSWDAHSAKSLALATKFGYEPAGEYAAYEFWQVECPVEE